MTEPGYKVLDLRDSPWVDGPGRTILQSASMVDKNRWAITIGAFYGDSHGEHAYMQRAEELGLDVLPVKENSAFDRKVVSQILNAIKSYSFDIIHTHDFRSDIYGLICSRISSVPLVSTCHGWIANNLKGRIYTRIDKWALRHFDEVISVSDTMREQLIGMGIRENRITVIRNALVIDEYQPNKDNNDFRRELGIDDDVKIIANIGRLSPEKGQDIFIEAAHLILKRHTRVCFVLIGIGPEQQAIEALVDKYGIRNHVIFAGYRGDMKNVYHSIDLVVQSSYTEGMPNVILESLLMAVPVVATDVGGTREIVSHQQTGLLIDAHNLEQLVDGIEDYLKSPEKHASMAAEGRKYVERNFDHNNRVARLMDVYDKVLNRRREAR